MAEERVQRRLAAILAADVVGFSRLMEVDEAATLVRLKQRRREILGPLVSQHRGRIAKVMGDGVLVEFASAVNAVTCAVELQQAMDSANAGSPENHRIVLRAGVNLGDVLVEAGDLYGEGVNIAARLQALAEPGSVYLSQTVFNHVRGKLQFGFEDLGEHSLKNMAEPVRIFKVSRAAADPAAPRKTDRPSRISIAVLPFANLSGDAEQEYFSDGITEDIITDLSKASALSVTARNTTFAFKGKMVDVSKIADQLKVSHVLEGSVRKAGGRVRISAQLIDGRVGDHIWAERYDRNLKDIFALQDEISNAIVAALKGKLLPEEKKAIETRSTHNPEAYQLYLLARLYQRQRGARNLMIAVRFCQRALNSDPSYARAWALIALCQAILHTSGKSEETGLSAAEKALALDSTLAEAHAAKGRALAELGRLNEALAAHEESLRLEPDSNDVRHSFGRTCSWLGRHEDAVTHFERAAQLLDTDYASPGFLSQSYKSLGRNEEAKSSARWELERIEREISLRPDNANAMMRGAVALGYLGETERAKEWASRALTIEPNDDPIDQYNLACAFVQMNEFDQAIEQLETCLGKMSVEFVLWAKQDGDLTLLHQHPRFQALVAWGEAKLAAARAAELA
ncbi:adenylate/guanylate cyclase domain-containing protein [Mesorhizobium sp. LjNodule214]|uniref:adenylate/guanylate cyclase domain-containing protein n=1 Tax=Mesorhizobium sp. LjNodule214 TaxID=3342252 RepID=UPI003ECCA61B